MKKHLSKAILSVFTISTIFIACNCNKEEKKIINKAAEMELIRSAINNSIGWAKNKDFNVLYKTIANDSNYLEVDPAPGLIKGFTEFKKNEIFWGSPDFKAIRYEIRDQIINFSQGGDVAWYYCILDDINEWKGKPAEWRNTRWTGVLEREKDDGLLFKCTFHLPKSR